MGDQPVIKRENNPQVRRRSGQLSSVQITFAVILAVGLILAINFSSRIAAGRPLLEAYNNIQTEIAILEREQQALQEELDYALSDAYVEQWARENGKMILPGERLVIPVPSGNVMTPTPIPLPINDFETGEVEPQPWELWWILFFDSAPPSLNGE